MVKIADSLLHQTSLPRGVFGFHQIQQTPHAYYYLSRFGGVSHQSYLLRAEPSILVFLLQRIESSDVFEESVCVKVMPMRLSLLSFCVADGGLAAAVSFSTSTSRSRSRLSGSDAEVPSKPSFTSVCGVDPFPLSLPLAFVPFCDLLPNMFFLAALTVLCSSAIFLSLSLSCLSSSDIWTAIADVVSLLLRSCSVSSEIFSVSPDMRRSLSLRAASASSRRTRK